MREIRVSATSLDSVGWLYGANPRAGSIHPAKGLYHTRWSMLRKHARTNRCHRVPHQAMRLGYFMTSCVR